MIDILNSAIFAVIFLAVAIVDLILAWYVIDALTPGHKIGDKLNPRPLDRVGSRQGVTLSETEEASHSAALIASTWMITQAAIIFTAIYTNAHGTDFWAALGWTVTFSIVGLAMQSVAFVALDAITPGKLGDEVCTPGPTVPIAKVASANILAVGIIVIACIS